MKTGTESIPQLRFTTERYPLLLFFDGECAFCDRWVNRLKDADSQRRIRFGVKQGRTFQEVVSEHPEAARVESVVLVKRRADGGEDFLVRSAAVREIIQGLAPFRFFAMVLRIVPGPISDIGYRLFSKVRTRVFGRLSQCRVPTKAERELFVE